jgi:hypothetical protein
MVIVNDILDFSKIAEGKKEIELLEVNPKVEFEKTFLFGTFKLLLLRE